MVEHKPLGPNLAYLMISPNPEDGLLYDSKNKPMIFIKSGDAATEDRARAYDTDNPSCMFPLPYQDMLLAQ